jgi:hypothetical protein
MGFEVVSSRDMYFAVFQNVPSFGIPYDADSRRLGWQERGGPE